jgi:hypothetical protein
LAEADDVGVFHDESFDETGDAVGGEYMIDGELVRKPG